MLMRMMGRGKALNEGRGANPGDTLSKPTTMLLATTLNEGRGANPGDTLNSLACATWTD